MSEELFIIGEGAWRALSPPEVEATIADLQQLGLCQLPYPKVSVMLGGWAALPVSADADNPRDIDRLPDDVALLYTGVTLSGWETAWVIDQRSGKGWRLRRDADGVMHHAHETPIAIRLGDTDFQAAGDTGHMYDNATASDLADDMLGKALVTLLATRNAVKSRRENKLAKLGIGNKRKVANRYRYTTTISLPDELPIDDEHKPTGAAKAPHLRRGHIRRQRYGPELKFTKPKWIEPVFVNADPGFVSQRDHYNIGGRP